MSFLKLSAASDFCVSCFSGIREEKSHITEDCGACSVGSMEEGGRLMNVDVVVLDEVHYLSDISRGTVWEETVFSKTQLVLYLMLCHCPNLLRLLCHSYLIVARLSRSSSAFEESQFCLMLAFLSNR